MLVHVERSSPRVVYVLRHVLERMLGLETRHVRGMEEFREAIGPKLCYTRAPIDGAVHVPWSWAIEERCEQDPLVTMDLGSPCLFMTDAGEDIFAGIFHHLSLVDEIQCKDRDVHGRVPSASLFTVRSGIADRPWVEEKVQRFALKLEHSWPGLIKRRGGYANQVTVDMDNILRYAGRPLGRALGASVKELLLGEWPAMLERWRVRSGSVADPFGRAIELVKDRSSSIDRTILFFLMRGGTDFDHAAAVEHAATRAVIIRAGEVGEVGVHPSYATMEDSGSMRKERDRLQHIIGRPVTLSRQHFLRWTVPATLRGALEAGVTEEHSLGFTDRVGFRAGTCTPFPWYDLEREQETSLMLHPFAVMDSALIERMKLDPAEVVATMSAMSDLVRKVDGPFVSVWHDRYLSGHREFASWPEVFKRVMRHARR
ncbi:MAG TPA: polysaccharide deacetylase family protein [Flavobacteriales bacterium]|nr:polysaccharide deacetylase family protein [Flavobacteriales bacterium]HNU56893.1 polysaccharide deacetylase family protein [Flavobacteriales bacterium]